MKKDSKKKLAPQIKDGVASQPNLKTGMTSKAKNPRSPLNGEQKHLKFSDGFQRGKCSH